MASANIDLEGPTRPMGVCEANKIDLISGISRPCPPTEICLDGSSANGITSDARCAIVSLLPDKRVQPLSTAALMAP